MSSEIVPKNDFSEVVGFIRKAREKAFRSVNTELINLYWQIGEYISKKVEAAKWGKGIVTKLAEYIKEQLPDSKGFNRRGLYRMKHFYETYRGNEKVSTLLTQIPWSAHLHILSKTKSMEEKEFYLRLAIKERYSVREIERQIDSGLYERTMISNTKLTDFKPEYLGKMNFYLEALDRDVKMPHENPSVGVILCKSKDSEVVEYALSRNLSPSLVAEYKTKLIDKRILQEKLHELFLISEQGSVGGNG